MNGTGMSSAEMDGMFITFEGIDGVGKTTQAQRLKAYLEGLGREVVMTREPGGTALGASIRTLLLSNAKGAAAVSPRAEALLYAADRAENIAERVRPALARGAVVISDRYIDSSVAYQAGGRELSEAEITGLSQWATGNLWPIRTYLLDMPPVSAHRRVASDVAERGHGPDRLESEPDSFQQRVRAEFLRLAGEHPQRFRVIDASQPIDAVWAAIRADIDAALAEFAAQHLPLAEQQGD